MQDVRCGVEVVIRLGWDVSVLCSGQYSVFFSFYGWLFFSPLGLMSSLRSGYCRHVL